MNAHRERTQTLPGGGIRRGVAAALSRPDLIVRALRRVRSDAESVQSLCRVLHLSPAVARAVLDQLDELRRTIGADRRRGTPRRRSDVVPEWYMRPVVSGVPSY